MGVNSSPLAQEDIRQALDRALETEKGIKITFRSGSAKANSATATYTRSRMHKLRAMDRKNNAQIYVKDHPMHNTSIWDGIIISKNDNEDGSSELLLTKSDLSKFEVEDIK